MNQGPRQTPPVPVEPKPNEGRVVVDLAGRVRGPGVHITDCLFGAKLDGAFESTAAELSVDRRYRYTLTRRWSNLPIQVWCMLNPSTADANQDDPTIRKCMSYARREGYGGIHVVNLMAYRATDPAECLKQAYPCGPDNDEVLREAERIAAGNPIVVAWGAKAPPWTVERAIAAFAGAQLVCLGVTKDGSPRHPLYVAGAQPFRTWLPPGQRKPE